MKSAARARKEQKKKAKRCKDPSLRYLEPDYPVEEMPDPDRPAFRKQQATLPINRETGTVEARPFGSDETTKEGFQVPKVPGTGEQYSVKRPKYFGASADDTVEDFAPFTTIIGDDPAYRLDAPPPATGSPSGASVQDVTDYLTKFQGGDPALQAPNLEDAWKPITPPGSATAFFEYLATPRNNGSTLQKRSASPALGSDVSKKFDEIFSRLDQLEQVRRQSSQTEVLLFVGTGILLLGSLELICRRR